MIMRVGVCGKRNKGMSPLTLQLNFQKTATNHQGFLPDDQVIPSHRIFHQSLSFQRERSFSTHGLSRVLSR